MKKLKLILSLLLLIIITSCTVTQTIVKGQCECILEYEKQKWFLVTKEGTEKGNFLFQKKHTYRMDSFIPGSKYYYTFWTWKDKFDVGDTLIIYDLYKEDYNVKIRTIQ